MILEVDNHTLEVRNIPTPVKEWCQKVLIQSYPTWKLFYVDVKHINLAFQISQ